MLLQTGQLAERLRASVYHTPVRTVTCNTHYDHYHHYFYYSQSQESICMAGIPGDGWADSEGLVGSERWGVGQAYSSYLGGI